MLTKRYRDDIGTMIQMINREIEEYPELVKDFNTFLPTRFKMREKNNDVTVDFLIK